jgi:2-oxoglutarate ferredoxin oxidoreductase subunit gamma
VIINSSLATDDKIYKNKGLYRRPFSEMAKKMGNLKVANVIALGFYVKNKGILPLKTFLQVISDIAPQNKSHLVEINRDALRQGASLG